MNTVIPLDSLRAVFTPSVLTRLRKNRSQSEQLRWRLAVLEACGPMPTDQRKAADVRMWRAYKTAWEAYLKASYVSGLFEGHAGKDLCGKLTAVDDNNFRSAMAECMVCWFLKSSLGGRVERVPQCEHDKHRDFQVWFPDQTVCGIEVKSPFRQREEQNYGRGRVWGFSGDDSDRIAQCLKKANGQFKENQANMLVIAPELRIQMFQEREILVKALYAKSAIAWPVCHSDGTPVDNPPVRTKLLPTGKFLETKQPSGKPLKQNGLPAYRRISAVMCIEEMIKRKLSMEDGRSAQEYLVLHNAMILHNPYAYHSIPESTFGDLRQFVQRDSKMIWTDGYECEV